LFEAKAGNCDDFSSFVMFILIFHGYDEVYQILMEFPPLDIDWFPRYHMIAVFKEGGYLNFSDNTRYIQGFCKDFKEIMNFSLYHGWISYVVYDANMDIIEKGNSEDN